MVELFGPSGNVLNPKQPRGGFYHVGDCPTCKSPVYYHGGGEQVIRQSTVDEQVAKVHPQLFPSCPCFFDTDLEQFKIAVPTEHNILLERQALGTVFEKLGALVYAYSELLNQGLKKRKPQA